jgi:hypothetical protein
MVMLMASDSGQLSGAGGERKATSLTLTMRTQQHLRPAVMPTLMELELLSRQYTVP